MLANCDRLGYSVVLRKTQSDYMSQVKIIHQGQV